MVKEGTILCFDSVTSERRRKNNLFTIEKVMQFLSVARKHYNLKKLKFEEKRVYSIQQLHTSNNCAIHAVLNIECLIRLNQSIGQSIDESIIFNATDWFGLENAKLCRHKLANLVAKVTLQGFW